ncbi:DUF2946 domain-containing protein [Erwiniaceae bacterium CAU 1747]
MVSLSRLSQRRMPAFIAVMAILMLFIAPEVSKTLVQWRAANALTAEDQHGGMLHAVDPDSAVALNPVSDSDASVPSAPMHGRHHNAAHSSAQPMHDMAKMSASGMTHHDASQPDMNGSPTMSDLACGYCDLLVHFPFMIWVLVPLIWLLCTATRAPPVRLIVLFFATFLPGTHLPRAPPAC